MTGPASSARRSRRPLLAVWAVIGAAIVAVAALLASERLNADVLPKAPEKPVPLSVQCFDADGDPLAGWSTSAGSAGKTPRVEPLAVCDALWRDHSATAEMDRIATQQQALGRDCVTFDATGGEHWALTGLVSSPQGTYTARGGPAPGRLPDFGEVTQPAPLASLAPLPVATSGCVRLSAVSWDLAVPAMVACTSDGTAVSVYMRPGRQTARAVCAAKGLVVVVG